MGTASTKKFIKNNAGTLTEEAALTTSAGQIVQRVGFATSTTSLNFNAGEPIVLA